MKTNWLLIGNGNYDDKEITNVSRVLDSIDLLSESIKNTYKGNVEIFVHKDLTNSDFLDRVDDYFCHGEVNTLNVFYFCGHGYRKDDNLYLAAKDSNLKAISNSSVEYDYIQKCVKKNRISHAVIILDCCYSGIANGLSIEEKKSDFLPKNSYPNIICITSCMGVERAYFDENQHAAFTANFALILNEGVENRKHYFSFFDLYKELEKKLTSQNPTITSKGLPANWDIIPNNRYNMPKNSLFFVSKSTVPILKVLLVKSAIDYPIKVDGDFGIPLGLWLLKSYIQRTSANIQVDIFDERLRNLQHSTQTFDECIKEYDIIGVSMCSCEVPPSIEKVYKASANGIITIAGGIFTYSNEEYLLNNAPLDFVIPGVGTKPLERLLTELRKRKERDPTHWKETVRRQISDKTFETIDMKNVFSKANLNDAVMWDAATMPHIELDI